MQVRARVSEFGGMILRHVTCPHCGTSQNIYIRGNEDTIACDDEVEGCGYRFHVKVKDIFVELETKEED